MMNQNTQDKDRELWISKALAVYEKIPGNRKYAVDDTAAQSFGATALAWYDQYVATQENEGKSTSFSLKPLSRRSSNSRSSSQRCCS